MTDVDPLRDERGWRFNGEFPDPLVYRAGFATTQEAYEGAVFPLFDTLDKLDKRLSDRRYVFGDRQTHADRRLFTTLLCFDTVY